MTRLLNRHRTRWFVLAVLMVAVLIPVLAHQQGARAAAGEVLILRSTLYNPGSSFEEAAVTAAGKTLVVKTPTEWASLTAANFASYDAIVLGDPDCQSGTTAIAAAEANASVWGPEVTGNVIIIGSDPVWHAKYGNAGAQTLISQGIAFALADPAKTGAYLDLSCYYHSAGTGTAVPVLNGLGSFSVTGAGTTGALNNVRIVATHPSLAGLTDASLSNWYNSVHENFETWPTTFEVLAIAVHSGGSHTATDGTVGYPYILARGVEIISDIDLSPDSAENPTGSSHTLTATVTKDDPVPGTPVVGTTVTFDVIAGPHVGTTGMGVTDSSGQASFTYTGTAVGIDTIEATFVSAPGPPPVVQRSNRVTKEWTAPADTTPPEITATVSGTMGNNDWYVSDVTVSWTVIDNESPVTSTSGCGTSNVTSDTGGTTFTCTATSAGGTASASVTVKRDATAPTIATAVTGTLGGNGWYVSEVDVSFTCTDGLSGVASCSGPVTLGEGEDQSVTGTAVDNAGNTASAPDSDIDIDLTPPECSCAETTNPSGKNTPKAGKNPKSGQNPDGFYILNVSDELSGASEVSLEDTGSLFVAGPYADGTKIKLIQAPGATPNAKPGPGVIDWQIKINGDGLATATDAAGNTASAACLVPPPPK